jgi:hypothetical protein
VFWLKLTPLHTSIGRGLRFSPTPTPISIKLEIASERLNVLKMCCGGRGL